MRLDVDVVVVDRENVFLALRRGAPRRRESDLEPLPLPNLAPEPFGQYRERQFLSLPFGNLEAR